MQFHSSKVILVEDNPADAELTKLAFASLGRRQEIVHCQDGEELLKYLQQGPLNEICYILLDLNMPRLNGIEVLKTMHADPVLRQLPIIVFTSSTYSNDVLNCYDVGANAYVVKPLDLVELDRVIRLIDDFWGKINVRPSFSS